MADAPVTSVVSHWNQRFEGFYIEPKAFYETLKRAIEKRKIPDIHLQQVVCQEGGIMSAKRLYLRVTRKDHTFDICGAPFGNGFFMSWWLIQKQGCLLVFAELPFIGPVFKVINQLFWPLTYYRLDTAMMFQSAVHGAVLDVIDRITEARGIRALSESERKPIMRDFLQK